MKLLFKDVKDTGNTDAHDNFIFHVDGETDEGKPFEDAYVAVKSRNNAPTEGPTEDWNLSVTDKGWRLKRAFQQQSFGGGRRDGRSPQDEERIARAVALKAAVDLAPKDGSVTSEDAVKVAETFLPFLRGE